MIPILSLITLITFLQTSVLNSHKLIKKPTSTPSQNFFLNGLIHLCMYLNPPSPTKVFNVINVLGSKKTIGCDHIPSEFTKFSANVIAQYLHNYFNFAFNFGVFSDSRKIDKKGIQAKLTRIFMYLPIIILIC